MIINIIVIIVLVMMYSKFEYNRVSNAQHQKAIYYALFILVSLSAMGYVVQGTDRMGYMDSYNDMSDTDFTQLIIENPAGIGFYLFSKVFAYSRLPYHFWFGFVELVFVSGIYRMSKRYCGNSIVLFIFVYTIDLFTFSLTGMKQTLAMGLVFHAYAEYLEKRKLTAILLFIASYFCHKSALIFLAVPIIDILKNSNRFYPYLVLVVTFIAFYTQTMLDIMVEQVNDERYTSYLTRDEYLNSTAFVFYSILLIIAVYIGKTKKILTKDDRFIVGCAAICVSTQLFALYVGTAFRLAMYFTPFLLMLLSKVVVTNKRVFYLFIIISAVWLIQTTRYAPYKFFFIDLF